MIIFKHGMLSKKEKTIVENILDECNDIYGDAYLTKNNLRLFIKENIDLVYDGLAKGDKIAYEEGNGFIYLFGWSDKAKRKYIKILTKNENATNRLLKTLHWHVKETLWVKVKKNNPVKRILERNGFKFQGDRGKEVLLCRSHRPFHPIEKKEEDNEKE